MANSHGEKVLKYLEENKLVNSLRLAELWNEDHQKIVGTVKSLLCLGEVRCRYYFACYIIFIIHVFTFTG